LAAALFFACFLNFSRFFAKKQVVRRIGKGSLLHAAFRRGP
jgi:hypothetical protein